MQSYRVFSDKNRLANAAADLFIQSANTAIQLRGLFSVCLSGGSSPKGFYELLVGPDYRIRLDWNKIHFFWGDERCVPPGDPDSNYRMAREFLLDHLPVPTANIHRIHGEMQRDDAALEYENKLKAFFQTSSPSPKVDTFDLAFLGVGEDGHTASLFPGSPALKAHDRWVIGVEHSTPPAPLVDRISLTLPVINASRKVVFLVLGAGKADIITQLLSPVAGRSPLPANLVQPHDGEAIWLLDAAAASGLPESLV